MTSSAGGPVLGRYTRAAADETNLRTVQLLAMPIALFLRGREHHDELIREFTLMAIRGDATRDTRSSDSSSSDSSSSDSSSSDSPTAADSPTAPRDSGPALPPRLRELVDILGRRFGASTSRADMERDAAIERGDLTVDLTYHVPASFAGDIRMLSQLMDDADTFCRMEKLLTLPRDPTMVVFGHWYNEEFLRQIDGLPPTPWNGPLE